MYSYGPPHMAVQKQDDQHEHTFSNCVRIQDVVLKTCLGRWTIGKSGERGSGISVLPARHDDDIYIYIYIYIYTHTHWGASEGECHLNMSIFGIHSSGGMLPAGNYMLIQPCVISQHLMCMCGGNIDMDLSQVSMADIALAQSCVS